MNIVIHPLFAGLEGYGEGLNRLDFAKACALAVAALIVFLLPRRWRALRWVSIGLALVTCQSRSIDLFQASIARRGSRPG